MEGKTAINFDTPIAKHYLKKIKINQRRPETSNKKDQRRKSEIWPLLKDRKDQNHDPNKEWIQ